MVLIDVISHRHILSWHSFLDHPSKPTKSLLLGIPLLLPLNEYDHEQRRIAPALPVGSVT